MQFSSKFLIFFLSFILLAAISFFTGLKMQKTKVIYLPIKTNTFPSPVFAVNNILTVTAGGKVKEITESNITIASDDNNKATFKINKDTSVFARDIKPSSASGTVKIASLPPEIKVPITNIKIGETVALELTLSQQEITIKSVHILNY